MIAVHRILMLFAHASFAFQFCVSLTDGIASPRRMDGVSTRSSAWRWQTLFRLSRGRAGTLTQQRHKRLVGTATQRVESGANRRATSQAVWLYSLPGNGILPAETNACK